MLKNVLFFLMVLHFHLDIFAVGNVFSKKQHERDITESVVEALSKITHFFEQNYGEVNLDAIFGVRAAEGTLSNILEHHHDNLKHAPSNLTNQLTMLHNSIRKTAKMAFKKLNREKTEYTQLFHPIISSRWYYERPVRPPMLKKPSVPENSTQDFVMGEAFSDTCMTGLMGTSKGAQKCTITKKCWEGMNSDGTQGYTLTHQVLFFLLADVIGCRFKIDSKLSADETTFDDRLTLFGSDIFHELEETASSGYNSHDHDLFLEQSIVCSWLGIQHCIDHGHIKEVLSWQDESGCYKDGNVNTGFKGPWRSLQEEHVLADGCQSHTSGLLIAYLVSSLHWIFSHKYPKQKSKYKHYLELLNSSNTFIKDAYQNYFHVLLIVSFVMVVLFCGKKRKIWSS